MTMTSPGASPSLPAPAFRVYRDFLTVEQHAAILDWSLASESRFEPAMVGDGKVNPQMRRSLILPDLGPLRQDFKRRLADMAPEFIRELRITPFTASKIELELAAHNEGAHFARHSDTYTGGSRKPHGDRVLSGVYYFYCEPKGFSGGALRLHRFGSAAGEGGFADIEPEQNCLVVFASWAPHEVLKVRCLSSNFRDSRFAVNCWMYRAR